MLCKRGDPMRLELLDSDEEFIEIDVDDDDDNETHEDATEDSNTEQSNNMEDERDGQEMSEDPRVVGQNEIDDSYELEIIVGATHCFGQIHFLVKWTHSNRFELVQSRVINLKFPAQVIAFYEQRMRFVPNE